MEIIKRLGQYQNFDWSIIFENMNRISFLAIFM